MDGNTPAHTEIPLRFMVYHLNPVSARLRFLKSTEGHVCLPRSLPSLSDLHDGYRRDGELAEHPARHLQSLSDLLGVSLEALQLDSSFRCWVDTPSQVLPVLLVRVNRESPFAASEGYQWIELPDSFRLRALERQIMRQCYQWLME